MNKNIKILSTVLVSILGLSYGTSNTTPKKENGPLVVRKLLRENAQDDTGVVVNDVEAPAQENKVSDVLAQISTPADGKISIRFVAGIDTYTYNYAAFNITLKDASGEATGKTATYQVKSAYTGIQVGNVTKTVSDLYNSNYNYLIAYTMTDIPADYWNYNFEVTASIGSDAENVTTGAVSSAKNILTMAKTDFTAVKILPTNFHPHGGNYLQFRIPGYVEENIVGGEDGVVATANGIQCTVHVFGNDGNNINVIYHNSTVALETSTYDFHLEFYTLNGERVVSDFRMSNKNLITLDSAKEDAINELESYPSSMGYSENKYSSDNWLLLQGYLSSGKEAINAATSFDIINVALEEAKANIDSVEKLDVIDISILINEAKTNLDNYVNTLTKHHYSETNWGTIETIKSNAFTALDECTTEEAINSIVDQCKLDIDAVEKDNFSYDSGINSAVSGAWLYYSLKWENNKYDIDSIISVSDIDGNAYTGEVGAPTIDNNSNTLKAGLGFAGAGFQAGEHHITVVVRTLEGSYYSIYTTFNGSGGSNVDMEILSTIVSKLNTHVITLDAGAGKCDTTSIETLEGSAIGTLPKASREGYNFLGWYTEENGGGEKVTSSTIASKLISTLYAHYEEAQEGDLSTAYISRINSAVNGAWLKYFLTWTDDTFDIASIVSVSDIDGIGFSNNLDYCNINNETNTLQYGFAFANAGFQVGEHHLTVVVEATSGIQYSITTTFIGAGGNDVDMEVLSHDIKAL